MNDTDHGWTGKPAGRPPLPRDEHGNVDRADPHGWTGGVNGRWGKPQYVALLECVGSYRRARSLADAIIIWREDKRPPDIILRSWETEWQDGKVAVNDADVRRMRQRLAAHEEWANREAIDSARKAVIALCDQAADGTLSPLKQVQMQYAGMNVAYMTKETAVAFGTPKPTQTAFQQIVINAGDPPKRLKQPKRKALIAAAENAVIDADFREVESVGNSDTSDL